MYYGSPVCTGVEKYFRTMFSKPSFNHENIYFMCAPELRNSDLGGVGSFKKVTGGIIGQVTELNIRKGIFW